MIVHVQAPEIGEWCTWCQRYTRHDNGWTTTALVRAVIRCQRCDRHKSFWSGLG